MNSAEEFVRYYLEEAAERLDSGRRSLKGGRYATAVFYAQECVEYAIKSVLESLSVQYPAIHDVSEIVGELRDDERLPRWFRAEIPGVSDVISGLAERRIPARYGDQLKKIPPSKLFRARDARKAIADAQHVLKVSHRFVEWWFGERGK